MNTFPPALKFPITSSGFIRKINIAPVWIFLRFVTSKFMSHCEREMSGSVENRWLVAWLGVEGVASCLERGQRSWLTTRAPSEIPVQKSSPNRLHISVKVLL